MNNWMINREAFCVRIIVCKLIDSNLEKLIVGKNERTLDWTPEIFWCVISGELNTFFCLKLQQYMRKYLRSKWIGSEEKRIIFRWSRSMREVLIKVCELREKNFLSENEKIPRRKFSLSTTCYSTSDEIILKHLCVCFSRLLQFCV